MPTEISTLKKEVGNVRWFAWLAAALSILAIIAALWALLDDDSEPGPAGSVVRLRNASGQDIPPGMRVKRGNTSTGLPPAARRSFGGGDFAMIPAENDPGGFVSGDAPADPGYRYRMYNPPPNDLSYVFTFDLADGTKFQGVACSPAGANSGTHIYEVEAIVHHRKEPQRDGSEKTFYWMEFNIAYAVRNLAGQWVYMPHDMGQMTPEVEAGYCLGPDCPPPPMEAPEGPMEAPGLPVEPPGGG